VAGNKYVSREREPIEFRPIAGGDEEWAGLHYVPRSRLWDWLGLYPVGAYLVLCLWLLGVASG
jgi:hypothetical protein